MKYDAILSYFDAMQSGKTLDVIDSLNDGLCQYEQPDYLNVCSQ